MNQVSETRSDLVLLIRYHEVALKGANRRWFEERLVQNIRKIIKNRLGAQWASEHTLQIERVFGRILLKTQGTAQDREEISRALSHVFGVTSFSAMKETLTHLETIVQASLAHVREYLLVNPEPKTFRVTTRRSHKVLVDSCMEMDQLVGSTLQAEFPAWKVDLTHPDLTLGIELRKDHSFIWIEKRAGASGLPVGVNARALCLLSGGFDSPVAAIRTLRRGSPVTFLHFYGTPYVGEEVLEKMKDLVRVINQYQPEPQPLDVVPFGKIQERIALANPPKLRTVLYRRMMFRIASRIAEKYQIPALVTGESVGQVASQTIENLVAIDAASTVPVLRPLVAYDKYEILAEAMRWGTHDISIRPVTDCCTLFSDRHPVLHSRADLLLDAEAKMPIEEWVNEAIEAGYRIKVGMES